MFTHNGQVYAAYPMTIKLRNVAVAEEVLGRIKETIDREKEGLQISMWRIALLRFPELAMYVTEDGDYNAETLISRVNQTEKAHYEHFKDAEHPEPFDRWAAMEEARKWVQESVSKMMVLNEGLQKLMHYTTGAYPSTIGALVEGIGYVKEIVDRQKTPTETLALIDSPIESDFWQDVDVLEVADFIDRFRAEFKRRTVPSVEGEAVADLNDETKG